MWKIICPLKHSWPRLLISCYHLPWRSSFLFPPKGLCSNVTLVAKYCSSWSQSTGRMLDKVKLKLTQPSLVVSWVEDFAGLCKIRPFCFKITFYLSLLLIICLRMYSISFALVFWCYMANIRYHQRHKWELDKIPSLQDGQKHYKWSLYKVVCGKVPK